MQILNLAEPWALPTDWQWFMKSSVQLATYAWWQCLLPDCFTMLCSTGIQLCGQMTDIFNWVMWSRIWCSYFQCGQIGRHRKTYLWLARSWVHGLSLDWHAWGKWIRVIKACVYSISAWWCWPKMWWVHISEQWSLEVLWVWSSQCSCCVMVHYE